MVSSINTEGADTLEEGEEVVSDFIEICKEVGGDPRRRNPDRLLATCFTDHGRMTVSPDKEYKEGGDELLGFTVNTRDKDDGVSSTLRDIERIEKTTDFAREIDVIRAFSEFEYETGKKLKNSLDLRVSGVSD